MASVSFFQGASAHPPEQHQSQGPKLKEEWAGQAAKREGPTACIRELLLLSPAPASHHHVPAQGLTFPT